MKFRLSLTVLLLVCHGAHAQQTPDKPDATPANTTATTKPPAPDKAVTKAAADRTKASASSTDHLSLDTTTVTGNKELPKVMYIVPWKKAELGQLPGQPFNSLLNEMLQPVDREVFAREVKYYEVVSGKDRAGGGGTTQATVPTDSR